MDNENKRIIGFQITDEELVALDHLAIDNERTRSAEVRMAVRAWLKKHGIEVEVTRTQTRSRTSVVDST